MQHAPHPGLVPHPREELANALTHGVGAAAALAAGAVLVTLAWLLAGGIAYTAGTAFYLRPHARWSHAIWHLFVIVGSLCHYVAVMRHLL